MYVRKLYAPQTIRHWFDITMRFLCPLNLYSLAFNMMQTMKKRERQRCSTSRQRRTFNKFMHSLFMWVWDTYFSSLECFLLVYIVTVQFASEHIYLVICEMWICRFIFFERFSNTLYFVWNVSSHISYELFFCSCHCHPCSYSIGASYCRIFYLNSQNCRDVVQIRN